MKIIDTILDPYVKCIGHGCNKQFARRSEDYVLIVGNIFIGERGGLIGNAFPEKKTFGYDEVKQYIFCPECFKKAVLKYL